MANGLASMMTNGVDPTDPKVGVMLDRVNANPNLLSQFGLTWEQLIALNGEVKRLKQPPMPQGQPAPTVAAQLENEKQQLSQGLPTAMPQGSQMYDPEVYQQGVAAGATNGEPPVVHAAQGGVVAFGPGGTVPPDDYAESPFGRLWDVLQLRVRDSVAENDEQTKNYWAIKKASPGFFESLTPQQRYDREQEVLRLRRGSPAASARIPSSVGEPDAAATGPSSVSRAPRAPPSNHTRGVGALPRAPVVAPPVPPESAGLKALAAAAKQRQQDITDAKVPDLQTQMDEIEKVYKSQGIGKAAAAERAQLDAKELTRKKERKSDRWMNIAEVLFKMAATKSPHFAQAAGEAGAGLANLEGASNKAYRAGQDTTDARRARIDSDQEGSKEKLIGISMSEQGRARDRLEKLRIAGLSNEERGAEMQFAREMAKHEGDANREMQLRVARIQAAAASKNLNTSQSFVKDMTAAVATKNPAEIQRVLTMYERMMKVEHPQHYNKPVDPFVAGLITGPGGSGPSAEQRSLYEKYNR